MGENGYEKYNEWIDVIGKKCATMEPDVERYGQKYYKLDNGIGVLVKGDKVECIYENYEWPLNLNNQFSIGKGYSVNFVEEVRLAKFQTTLIEYKDSKTGIDFSYIKDEAHLPSAFEGNYKDGELEGYPNLNPDMRELLREAADRAINNQTKNEYEGAINFIERLEHIIEQEKSKDEKENGYEEYCKWFEVIYNACNENNLISTNDNGDRYYQIDENLYMCKRVIAESEPGLETVIISDERIEPDIPSTPHWTFTTFENGALQMRFVIPENGYIYYDSPAPVPDGFVAYDRQQERSFYVLPEYGMMDSKNIKKTDSIGELLNQSIETTQGDTQQSLKRAKAFYKSIQQLAEREMSGYDEYGYPEETENDAKSKETERKKVLIAQIRQAVDEGRDLDAKIMDAKDITKENK